MQQSAQALRKLLVSYATSQCYPQLQLLRMKLLKKPNPATSQQNQATGNTSGAAAEPAAEGAAASVAADWVCLLWLLQKAHGLVAEGLKAEWEQHQIQEFATWVRPASELHAVRSKAAAKVRPPPCQCPCSRD